MSPEELMLLNCGVVEEQEKTFGGVTTQWNTTQQFKGMNYDKCNNMDESQNKYAQRNQTGENIYSRILFT